MEVSQTAAPSEKKILKRKVEKELFSIKKDTRQQQVSKKKKQEKKEKKSISSVFDVVSVPALTYGSLTDGQLLLGWVSQVLEYELKISLPGHLVASVPITNISSAFNTRLRAATDAGEEEVELPSLDSLFSVGDLVAGAVVSVDQIDSKYNLILSLSPSRVSSGRSVFFTSCHSCFITCIARHIMNY